MGYCFLYKRGQGSGGGGGKLEIVLTALGSIISLADSSSRKLKGLRIFGKTIQNGTPSPAAPVPLESVGDDGNVIVTVDGKNLFNWLPMADGALGTSNGTLVETGNNYIILQGKNTSGTGDKSYSNGWYQPGANQTGQTKRVFLNKGDIVTVSADYTMLEYSYGSKFNIGLHLYSDGAKQGNGFDNVPAGVKTKVYRTFTVSESNMYYPVFSLNSGKAKIENIQIEYGSTATAYEPYKEPQTLTIPTPNGLPGIPVASGGNYMDENGQIWVCDEVDFVRGVYVQRIGEVTFNGSEGWFVGGTSVSTYRINYKGIAECLRNDVRLMCDSYPAIPIDVAWGDYDYFVSRAEVNSALCFRNKDVATVDEWKALLSQKPIKLQYILATPIETPLSAEELAQYAALHTNYPNTTIFNDEGADMEVKYTSGG